MDEQTRILRAYEARQSRVGPHFFSYENVAHLYSIHERYARTLNLLAAGGYSDLSDLRILDVGCDNGYMLRQFIQWGAMPMNLAGIDLRPEAIACARRLHPNLDIRCGSATDLPWPDGYFDLVCQHTVFTSILDPEMKQQIADEMNRVLCCGGAVLWYDFMYDNPQNHDVRGVKEKEIRALFPELEIKLEHMTLAPPIGRWLPKPLLPILYSLLSAIPLLHTHYLGLLMKLEGS